MKKLIRFLVFVGLIAAMASPTSGHQVALKDGKIIKFQKYRATETHLSYVDENGKEISVLLSDIDMERTRQLNASENPPLDFPGLASAASQGTSVGQPSLGQIARNLRKNKPEPAKHAFTTDDFNTLTAGTIDVPASGSSTPDGWRERLNAVRSKMAPFENMDAAKFSRWALGEFDVDFPGRKEWQEQLFEKKVSLLGSVQDAEKAFEDYQRTHDAMRPLAVLTKGEEEKFEQSRKNLGLALDRVQTQGYELDAVIRQGKERAKAWKGK
jgi:hypothetical protein